MRNTWLQRGLRLAGAVALAAALSGCVIYPYGPRYGYYHPYYHPYYY